jgi:hypothetical protein
MIRRNHPTKRWRSFIDAEWINPPLAPQPRQARLALGKVNDPACDNQQQTEQKRTW